jgi:hypothetical protein
MVKLLTLEPLESVAVLGLGVVFREAYEIGWFPFCHILIHIHFILLHMEFEDGLSISVLKTRATRNKFYNW